MNKEPRKTQSPLADRMRPEKLSEVFGQEKILGEGSFLYDAITRDAVPSLLFWGPPGCGKTTLALLIARETKSEFVQLSAVGSGVAELRKVVAKAEENREVGKKTILFIDEIHRWNKAQQDALLPHVEHGLVTLIGATTENPSFEVNSALLSRTRVLVLGKLSSEEIISVLRHALSDERGLKSEKIKITDATLSFIAEVAGGDARNALNILEACASQSKKITPELVEGIVNRSHLLYDKGGEWHYDIISALHKSLRGGDADGALYWLGRMLEAGEDPLYVARRLVRFASEDVGLANSFALPQAIAAMEAVHMIGMPECELALAQAVVYLAKSKKSNALYVGYGHVKDDVRQFPNEPVPIHLRNAPTKLMKNLGYGKDYKYTPDFENKEDAKQEYLPEKLRGRRYVKFSEQSTDNS
ncbi:MAG: replication-associated recombination protein A [Candidatus Moranbacteria bacterium]|nr:replication-associated recombination protein A [Candidatus Moranbacteria bacterium]